MIPEAETKKATASEPVEWDMDAADDGVYLLTDIAGCAVCIDPRGLVHVAMGVKGIAPSDLRAIADACDAKLAEVGGE